MSNVAELGREKILAGTINMTSDTIAIALMDPATADVGVKIVSGGTNATPIVLTVTAHGYSVGDFVYVAGVTGLLSANGIWKISATATNTITLADPVSGGNPVGSGAYVSGGYVINLGPSTSGDFWDDFSGAIVGSKQTLGSKTFTQGVFDAVDPSFSSVLTGNVVRLAAIFKDTGADSTSPIIAFLTGAHIVTVNTAAATSATTIPVEPLVAGIASGTVLTFSDGHAATLSGAAAAGDRVLTVSALAAGIVIGSRALAPELGSGLPITTNGSNIGITFDNGANKIFKL